jgi:hypothetical protein
LILVTIPLGYRDHDSVYFGESQHASDDIIMRPSPSQEKEKKNRAECQTLNDEASGVHREASREIYDWLPQAKLTWVTFR